MVYQLLQTYRSSFKGLSRETWLLSWVILINRCGYMAVPFMSMYITQSMHRSIADAGLVITLFGVGSVGGALAGGYLTDRVGFRPVQIVSLIASGAVFLVFVSIEDFRWFCALILVLAFFVEAFKPANSTAIASYSTPEDLTRSYALNRLATNIGFGFGTSVGGILAAIDYHLLFWVDGAVYALAGVLIWIFLPGTGTKSSLAASEPMERLEGNSPWKDLFFVRFLILVTIYMVAFVLLFRLVPVYWKEDLGISEATIGVLIGLNGVVIALFEMVMIHILGDRRGHSFYIVSGVVFCAVSYLVLTFTFIPAIVAGLLVVLFFTIGEMLTLPYMNVLVMSRASIPSRGKYAAAYALSWSIAQVIGPALGGYVANYWGYDSLWVILVLMNVFCALGFYVLMKGY